MTQDIYVPREPTTSSLAEPPSPYSVRRERVRIFVDHSNLHLTMLSKARNAGAAWDGFDWAKMPSWLVNQAASICKLERPVYEGAHIYVSHDPDDPQHEGRRKFARMLSTQVGVHVVQKQLWRKSPPTCRHCRAPIDACPKCGGPHEPRVEKGVDTAMVADMMSFAWRDTYDVAVLASSDSDFVPVVQHLHERGIKVVQAGVPPTGADLRRNCWASLDLFADRDEVAWRR